MATTYRLTVLPGDGVGPEVVTAALHVLDMIEAHSPLSFERTIIPCGGQHWLQTGEEWPQGSLDFCRTESDAILLGAIGWPGATHSNGDIAGGEVVLGLRSGLELFANVRPVKLYEGVLHKISDVFTQVWEPQHVNMLLIRENTEGMYHGLLSRSRQRASTGLIIETPEMEFPDLQGTVAWDPRPISSHGSERVIRYAFEKAMGRSGAPVDGSSRVTCVDKSNVTRGCQLFRRVFHEVAAEYPQIEQDEAYIDAFTMWLIRNPEWFDVVVLPNMFGDIATDLASVLQGGMGMAASGNIGNENAMFEPVHGSAPKHAGKGRVNPLATINSVQMMLDWLGEQHDDQDCTRVAALLDVAVATLIADGSTLTYDLGGTSSTMDVAAAVAIQVTALLNEQYASA
jgi:3-isopropylmalate dehydrogenase